MTSSRQIVIGRTGLSLADLNLNDPANGFYVSDNWTSGGQTWQRYNAKSSAWVNGDRVVGQRIMEQTEVFDIYIYASTPAGLKAKVQTLATALSQMRYSLVICWDGDTHTYTANGAGDLEIQTGGMDPDFHRAGWLTVTITITRDPTIG